MASHEITFTVKVTVSCEPETKDRAVAIAKATVLGALQVPDNFVLTPSSPDETRSDRSP